MPAFGFLQELKGALLLDVCDFQLLERGGHFRFARFREFVRRELVLRARALDRRRQLARGERFLRAEEKRFDDLGEVHMSHGTYTTSGPIPNRPLNRLGDAIGLAVDLRGRGLR